MLWGTSRQPSYMFLNVVNMALIVVSLYWLWAALQWISRLVLARIQKRRVLPTNRHGDDDGRLQMMYLTGSGPAARALADRGVAALAAVIFAAGDDPSSIDHHGYMRRAPATDAVPHAVHGPRLS